MLHPDTPALALAPMEGVTDAPMRAVQGATGAFTYAVTEFLRVSHAVPPRHVFHDHVPELRTGAVTLTGLPVQVQLLGGDAGRMAESAVRAHELGATAVDVNFGCPAPTVNRHDGGAALLRHPLRIREIVGAIRAALPPHVPVSAKLRLGWDTLDAIHENATMAAEGGAAWITIHGRTRVAGYAPPIHWKPIGRVRERLGIPVVANGDIWTVEDFKRCRDVTGCKHFMLGRGALADPRLARRVAAELGLVPPVEETDEPFDWAAQLRNLVEWSHRFDMLRSDKNVSRLKQWLRLASQFGNFAHFDRVKRIESVSGLFAALECQTGFESVSRISAATDTASALPSNSSA
ncbi:tRNA-dihydrouridine synthase family protein [Gemmata sp. JC673]|uniref:tRNA-dihydrouridine synthase n=1 Tax=Gemmata algarum TaxID=2975278 RepID=A0ABU5EXJ7_9BACT|nr:tRNA-dihydrouridine synthase family protein [Gemmata algarum]MDY3559185.1 tRNA-dihydrouridine synthase family protein [Gemmata algarum]